MCLLFLPVVRPQLQRTISYHNSEKGKDICSPFVIHETGSTSVASTSVSENLVSIDFAAILATTGPTLAASTFQCDMASKIIKAHRQQNRCHVNMR
ncbi:hypothetical protein P3L10_001325 [Capsicum annuum]